MFAIVATAVIGMVIELTVVRRLFNSPRLALLIATVGVAQLLLFLRISLPNIDAGGSFPLPFTGQWRPTDSVVMLPREILVLIVAPIVIVALALFMTRTSFGLAVRASSSNAPTARIYGISVKRTSTIVWTIAGAFAAITGILVAPLLGVTPGNIVAAGGVAIGPSLLLRALVVALIARMQSLPMTIVGGIAVGVFERIVLANVSSRDQSIVDLYLFVAALVLVLVVVRKRGDDTGWSLAAQVKPIPDRLRSLWYVRRLPQIGFVVLFGFLAVLPFFLERRSQEFLWTDIVIYALVALSITPLAGWAGQLSLGQFAFVGLGALTMVMLRAGMDIPVPFDLWDMQVQMAWLPAVICRDRGRCAVRARDRHPGAAGARPVPRGDHARVRRHVLELAVPAVDVDGLRVRDDDPAHRPTGGREPRLLEPPHPVLPVPRRSSSCRRSSSRGCGGRASGAR